jgi:hypothetical protein
VYLDMHFKFAPMASELDLMDSMKNHLPVACTTDLTVVYLAWQVGVWL